MKRLVKAIFSAVIIGIFATALGVGNVSAQSPLREILNRMDNHNKTLTTLRAKVTRVDTQAQLGESDTWTGTLIYAKGKPRQPLMRIDWEKPQESLAVRDGQYIMYRPRLNIAYTGSSKSAGKDTRANSALAFMSMSKAELEANYEVAILNKNVSLSNGVSTLQLQLTPKTKASYKSAEIWVDPNGMPQQGKVTQSNGDTTTVLLNNLEKNIKLDGSSFQIVLPKGTKIQKS